MDKEKYGHRDLTYSAWHRTASIGRYIDREKAFLLSVIDNDIVISTDGVHDDERYAEYIRSDSDPIVLIEVAWDRGQRDKVAIVTANMARKMQVSGYKVLYKKSDKPNPADPVYQDIDSFRVKEIWPYPDITWNLYTPKQYAECLWRIREEYDRQCGKESIRHFPNRDGEYLFRRSMGVVRCSKCGRACQRNALNWQCPICKREESIGDVRRRQSCQINDARVIQSGLNLNDPIR